jgi:hypothetical protein
VTNESARSFWVERQASVASFGLNLGSFRSAKAGVFWVLYLIVKVLEELAVCGGRIAVAGRLGCGLWDGQTALFFGGFGFASLVKNCLI